MNRPPGPEHEADDDAPVAAVAVVVEVASAGEEDVGRRA